MFTAAEKAECAERELKYRTRVYPRWIEEKRMTLDFASRQIAIMAAIAADYRRQADEEASQSDLFSAEREP